MKHWHQKIWSGIVLLTLYSSAQARPLLTEEFQTVGKKSFEVVFTLSERHDEFSDPKKKYKSVLFPVQARFGLSSRCDFGFTLTYASQRLDTENASFEGSQNNRFSPFLKYTPLDWLGVQMIWHVREPEQGQQNLPVVRGEDFEPVLLLKLPTVWPVNFNLGYIFRGAYKSKLGVTSGQAYRVEPGDIFEAKTSLEIPLKYHFFILNELAYYKSQESKIENTPIVDSAATALDGVVGLSWVYRGWNITAGAAFGLLEEKYTSFDLERGAGDVTYRAAIAYKLTPRKPNQ